MRGNRLVLLIALYATLGISMTISGCKTGGDALASPDLTVPDGWTKLEKPEYKLAIGVPPGWREGGPNANASPSSIISDTLGADPGNDPGAAAAVQQFGAEMERETSAMDKAELEELAKKDILISVIDSSARPIVGEERTRFYVKKGKLEMGQQPSRAIDVEKEFLKGEGAPQTVDLPVGKATRFDAEVTTIGGDKVFRISYVFVDKEDTYSLRFVATNDGTAIKNVAEAVAQTFRVTR